MRTLFCILGGTLALTAGYARPGSADDVQVSDTAVLSWAKAHAIPIKTLDTGEHVSDLRALAPMVGNARVVALGEPTHGAHEPLAFRNRLFQYLVEELGFTAIAIETGLPESRRLADFIAGGLNAPPVGDAARIVADAMTWGFGAFPENVELVKWIRAYNSDPAHKSKVRLYGIDLSLGGPQGSTPTPAALGAAVAYLEAVDVPSGRSMRATFAPYLKRLPGDAAFTPAEHTSLTAAIHSLVALLEDRRAQYIAAMSETDYAWAHRSSIVALQADRVLRANPPPTRDGGIPPAAWRPVTLRDSAMAENVRWVLEREGPKGRVLVFSHNLHIKNAPTIGGVWNAFAQPPTAMGQYMRRSIGKDLLIIGTSAPPKPPGRHSASVDDVLAQVGLRRFVLDLRTAPQAPKVAAWLIKPRALRTNNDTFVMLALGTAFDAVFFVDALTPLLNDAR